MKFSKHILDSFYVIAYYESMNSTYEPYNLYSHFSSVSLYNINSKDKY